MIVLSCKINLDQGLRGRYELRAAPLFGGYQLTPSVHGMVHGSFGIAYFIKCLYCFIQVILESFVNPRLIIVS